MEVMTTSQCQGVQGGSVLNDVSNLMVNGLTPAAKTAVVFSLGTGMILGEVIPFGALVGLGVIGCWIGIETGMEAFSFSMSVNVDTNPDQEVST